MGNLRPKLLFLLSLLAGAVCINRALSNKSGVDCPVDSTQPFLQLRILIREVLSQTSLNSPALNVYPSLIRLADPLAVDVKEQTGSGIKVTEMKSSSDIPQPTLTRYTWRGPPAAERSYRGSGE